MRVAIVNDVSLAREVLRRLVVSVPEHSVAWIAENGVEAVAKAAKDRPDIILMDLVMPVMDGVEATRRIMASTPCPILLVTSSVTGNFNQVYQAMGCGGLDAVNTPTLGPGGEIRDGEGILSRIGKLARRTTIVDFVDSQRADKGSGVRPAPSTQRKPPIVALGASTGGPEAVAKILAALPADLAAAVIVVQHIAAEFAPGLASWLQHRSRIPVRLVRPGEEPTIGTALLASTDDHLVLPPNLRLAYRAEPKQYPYRPSVDVLFESLATNWPAPGVAALLTGMGSDGARGMLALRRAGWRTIAQDEASSIVYGMPKAAVALQAAEQLLPLSQIAAAVVASLAPPRQSPRRS